MNIKISIINKVMYDSRLELPKKKLIKNPIIRSRFICKTCCSLSISNYCPIKEKFMKHKNMGCDKYKFHEK